MIFGHNQNQEPVWQNVGPELQRVSSGRRSLLRIALIGVLVNGLIGIISLLVRVYDNTIPDLDMALYFAAMLAVSSVLIYVLMLRAAKLQTADQIMLLEAFHGMISPQVIVDGAGQLVVANRAYKAWLGNKGDQAEAVLFNYFGADSAAVAELERMAAAARAGQIETAEISHRLSSGEMEWRRVIARPLQGWPGHMIWRLEDVSERRRVEERLREEQAKLADFMRQAPVGIYSADQTGRFLYVNQTLADWLGTTPDELVAGGVHVHDILAEPPKSAPAYALADTPDGAARADVVMRGQQGRLFPVAITQTISQSEDGLVVRTRSVVRDLTPERAWQEALTLSEQRFQRLFTDAPIGIALIDEQSRLVECNQAFVHLCGQAKSTLISRNFADLVREDEREMVSQRLAEGLRETGLAKAIEVTLGGDKPRVLQAYARRFTTAQTARGGLMLYFTDVTEQKKLQHQFVQSQKLQAVGQLAGGIAHDFNNLLTAIIGFCDLLLLRHRPGDQSFTDLMQVKQNANRAANLVRGLLAFSRQQTWQPVVIDFTDEIADLSNLIRRLIGANIELKLIHGRDLWHVKVDRVQLEQVVINLAVNARDAMQPKGGLLTIETANHVQEKARQFGQDEMPPGDYVKIMVRDTGSGIPPEIRQKIFEPFFSTKEIGAGTGLGLATVHGIMRQHGGFIGLESDVGVGTVFTVYFLRHTNNGEAVSRRIEKEEDEVPPDLTGRGTILLVEDEDAVRTFAARTLRSKGYEVIEGRTGVEGLILMEKHGAKIDLVISDVVMPEMDGPTMVTEIHKLRPEMKVIFVSGYTEDRLRDHFASDAEIHFLSKPFSLKQLAEKVKDVLAGADS